ncbi:hypothetical protein [Pseudomonas viridiflava]|uniref:hypothetical protein n=1 Tax=Pseudomonas viridiflava TaxID=33069 RepID=UPI000F084317|nr:hypothetical protein [Pseudomonas viridiflava]
MAQFFTDLNLYTNRTKGADDRRAMAVAAALSLIHAKASSTPADCNILTDEMNNLSQYADQIQEALKAK